MERARGECTWRVLVKGARGEEGEQHVVSARSERTRLKVVHEVNARGRCTWQVHVVSKSGECTWRVKRT